MDPLAAVVSLLRPRMAAAKLIGGAGRWAVRYHAAGSAGFGLVLSGEANLAVDSAPAVRLREGDFVLIPLGSGFVMSSDPTVAPVLIDPEATADLIELRHGERDGEPTFRMLGGYFAVEPANVALLADLLPAMAHIEGGQSVARRLRGLIDLVADEALADRPGRALIVERLVEVLLVEALRHRPERLGAAARAGLLGGLADGQVAAALRCIHAQVARRWTVAELAREAGMSRSAFSERFAERVGLPPMEYVIQWRMALAKDMLRRQDIPLETAAAAIGYESASAFSTAFRRQVGLSPGRYARAARADAVGTRRAAA